MLNSPGSKIKTDFGSSSYMSPEKIRGEDYGLPSDIWYFINFSIIFILYVSMIKGLWVSFCMKCA
jgi:serine/threonine protein kinase